MTQKKDHSTSALTLPKDVKDLLAGVDWDHLEEIGLEDEGQAVPMQDPPSFQFKKLSPEEAQKVVRVDPPNGFLKHVPKR
jgi:hypothetical protein